MELLNLLTQTKSTLCYIDPAATSVLLSSIVAIVVAIGASAIVIWRKVKKGVSKTLHIDPNANKEVEEDIVLTEETTAEETKEQSSTEAETKDAETENAQVEDNKATTEEPKESKKTVKKSATAESKSTEKKPATKKSTSSAKSKTAKTTKK